MELKTQQITELRISIEDASDLQNCLNEFFESLQDGKLEDEDAYLLYGTTLTSGKKESELTLVIDLTILAPEKPLDE